MFRYLCRVVSFSLMKFKKFFCVEFKNHKILDSSIFHRCHSASLSNGVHEIMQHEMEKLLQAPELHKFQIFRTSFTFNAQY